mgnify:FL=1
MTLRRLSFLALFGVIVLIFLMLPSFLRIAFPLHYAELIAELAAAHDLDPAFVAAVIEVESNFRPDAVSHKGAIGLMQIMPETAAWLGEQGGQAISKEHLFDPKINVEVGTHYLKYLLDRFPTDYAALAAYNAGPTNARRWLEEGLWDGSYERTGQIPFGETRSYVRKVIMMRRLYQLLYQP